MSIEQGLIAALVVFAALAIRRFLAGVRPRSHAAEDGVEVAIELKARAQAFIDWLLGLSVLAGVCAVMRVERVMVETLLGAVVVGLLCYWVRRGLYWSAVGK